MNLSTRMLEDNEDGVGARIRTRRLLLGLTQKELAASCGVKYQQIHKYEMGTNRVSASRLANIAGALSCSMDDLLGRHKDELEKAISKLTPNERMAVLRFVRALRHR